MTTFTARSSLPVRLLTLVVAVALAVLTPALASAQNVTYTKKTHTLNMNVGCVQGSDGTTCDTTSYWLGRNVGNNNVGSSLDFTPLGYVNGGNTLSFPADSSVPATYVLRADGTPLTATIQYTGFLGPVVAADSSVTLTVSAHVEGTPSFQRTVIGSGTVNKPLDTDGTYTFSFTIDPALDKKVIDGIGTEVTFGAISAASTGFFNGKGGSNIRLPYYEVTTTP
ncbi:hypothetical protein [Euzebya rosea]|uniref:hypothetical protein n=1 Tax=Euzebya rosea TaxID=2052804 RepID=UPI000D3E23F2|nr:hypothetical protein [Euzebya rosea]